MPAQHTHTTTPFNSKKFSVVVVCDGLQSPANVGSLFRICDAMGVEEIIFCNTTIDITSSRLQRTSRSTHKKVAYIISDSIITELQKLKEANYSLFALEITNTSIPVEKLTIDNQKIALVIGNERYGTSKTVLDFVKQGIHIEMYGANSSMNVTQAAGIALYALINKLKKYNYHF